jgi:hypothetical protein
MGSAHPPGAAAPQARGDGDGEQQGGRHEEAGQREHRQDDVGELGGDDGLRAPDQWLSQR